MSLIFLHIYIFVFVSEISISDFHVHPCDRVAIERLKEILVDNNKSFPKEALTSRIYKYIGDEDKLAEV